MCAVPKKPFPLIAIVTRCDDPPTVRQTLMSPTTIPQFAQPLPTLAVAGGTMATLIGNQPLTIRMCEFWANVLPPGTNGAVAGVGVQPKTRVWGCIEGAACPPNGPNDPALDTYIGPVIISQRSNLPSAPRPPTTITWVNELGTTATSQVKTYIGSTDQTIHGANPNGLDCVNREGLPAFGSACADNDGGPIPAVVHLHGGEVPPMLDGGPDAWFLSLPASGYRMHGGAYYSKNGDEGNQAVYAYPNHARRQRDDAVVSDSPQSGGAAAVGAPAPAGARLLIDGRRATDEVELVGDVRQLPRVELAGARLQPGGQAARIDLGVAA